MYHVKLSELHGKGLFASTPISEGTQLGICETVETQQAGLHTLTLPDGRLLDVVCDLKFINHSKTPNVSYYDDLTVIALRDIAAGEELLHDYGDEWR